MIRQGHLRCEAILCLIAARVAVRVLPFRTLARSFERHVRTPELDGPARDLVRAEVRRAVYRAALGLPGTDCFPRAIAAQAMLRRRGVATTLYWGAATIPGEGLVGHVWLKDGEIGVQGSRASGRYSALASFSPATTHQRSPA
jgi:Transglutaminase-like superfamily